MDPLHHEINVAKPVFTQLSVLLYWGYIITAVCFDFFFSVYNCYINILYIKLLITSFFFYCIGYKNNKWEEKMFVLWSDFVKFLPINHWIDVFTVHCNEVEDLLAQGILLIKCWDYLKKKKDYITINSIPYDPFIF